MNLREGSMWRLLRERRRSGQRTLWRGDQSLKTAEDLRESQGRSERAAGRMSIYLWRTCGVGSPLSGAC